MGVSNPGVSNIVNTSDGRAVRVIALNSNDQDHIGGRGTVNRFGSQPIGTQVILSQNEDYMVTESQDRLITQG